MSAFRPDGYIQFHERTSDLPNEPEFRNGANYTVSWLGVFVAQALWMFQGRAKPLDDKENDKLQLLFALVPPRAGHKLINVRTGTEYTIKQVLQNYRGVKYTEPAVKNRPESIVIKPRRWYGFHPDVLVGATVQVEAETFDFDPKQGDFFSLEESASIVCRQRYAETREHGDSGYNISFRIPRNQPGWDKEPFGGVRGIRPTRRSTVGMETNDPTMLAAVEAQSFHALVEFELEAPNALELNLLTDYFEAFMDMYRGTFRRLGFEQIHYWERNDVLGDGQDTPGTPIKRRLQYFVLTERIWPGLMPKLRSIDLEVNKIKDYEGPEIDSTETVEDPPEPPPGGGGGWGGEA